MLKQFSEIFFPIFDVSSNIVTLGTSKEKGTGTGLVLMLCKEFIERITVKYGLKAKLEKGLQLYLFYL